MEGKFAPSLGLLPSVLHETENSKQDGRQRQDERQLLLAS